MNQCWNSFEKIVMNEKVSIILSTSFQIIIEICLLAFYAQLNEIQQFFIQVNRFLAGDFKTFLQISIAGSVFMMISLLGVIGLLFYSHKYLVYFLTGFIGFAIFLLFIGMIIGGSQPQFINQYNIPVAFWFIQVMLMLLAYQTILRIKKNKVEQVQQANTVKTLPTHENNNEVNDSVQQLKMKGPSKQ